VRSLKEDRYVTSSETASQFFARRLHEELPETALHAFLAPTAVLVPVPRSSLLLPNALWPSLNLAGALVRGGLGARVLECLRRSEAIPKSALAPSGQRPTPQRHYDTLEIVECVEEPDLLCLVDDVVTKGATLLGAAGRLKDRYPDAEIRAFAAVRTLGLQPDIDRIIEPCVGKIRFQEGEAVREP